ncbi:hypothetical protein SETIT_5G452300v2 [Setaria italica]|uniref:GST C-terminal domain-containing protein n=2 Tax=Setaria TaxID=4554 RepID=A0A368RFX3_SETIT|nr:hypothetical protein SETIT_5G452300v2 [Setaria italica]TKW18846.1 hypothetical protein SEVIR_5G458400v2 [Setaria viridis]
MDRTTAPGGRRQRFFGGDDSIGLVDIAASNVAHWLGVMEEVGGVTPLLTDEEYPALCQWAKRYAGDETVKQCLPKRDELFAMYSGFKEMFQAMATSQNQ